MSSRTRPLALLLGLVLASGPLGCARLAYNFASVEAGEIYRSAQPSPLFLRWLVERRGIRTLVNLRGRTPGYESAFAARHGLRLYAFNLSASREPTAEDVERFLTILRDPDNYPMLVHCRNGVDRTGYMVGIYRMHDHGWSVDRAAREMNRFLQFELLNPVPQRALRRNAPPP
jgi:protein tyrosine/serine phosphatase